MGHEDGAGWVADSLVSHKQHINTACLKFKLETWRAGLNLFTAVNNGVDSKYSEGGQKAFTYVSCNLYLNLISGCHFPLC